MSSRRWGVGVAVVSAVAVVTVAGWVLLQPRTGDDVEHRSAAGGFTLTLPSSWQVHAIDSAEQPWNWIKATRPSRLGPADAWLWLNRTAPGGRDHLGTIRRYALEDIHRLWGDVDVRTEHVTFAGQPALRLRYSHPIVKQLPAVPGSNVDEVRLLTESAGQVYELGVAGWQGLPVDADRLEHVLHLTTPRGVRPIGDTSVGARLTVPATWNRLVPSEQMTDAVLTANDPSDPAAAWTILWRFDDRVASAISKSIAKAEREGTITRRSDAVVAGRRATRIDYAVAGTGDHPPYYGSTWIFAGPDGKAWQLLVGATTEVTSMAPPIASSLELL